MVEGWQFEWWGILLVFLVVTAVLHLTTVYPFLLGEVWWKASDYLWIGLTIGSLLVAAGDARRYFAQIDLDRIGAALQAHRRDIQHAAERSADLFCDRISVRSPYSPPDFDRIAEQHRLTCEWFRNAQALLRERFQAPDHQVEEDFLPLDERIEYSFGMQNITYLKTDLAHYRFLLADRDRKQRETAEGRGSVAIVLAPYLLAFAFAVRATKATAEICHALRKVKRDAA